MNYYQFHIADWALHTSHLSLEEEGIYRRLLDYYYDTESPIPTETQPVIRRLRLRGYEETVLEILQEFFVLEDDGWHNLRADSEIATYNAKAEQARTNGKKGGRPKKNKDLPHDNQEKTQPVISGNPEKSESKANQEPRTINREPKKKGAGKPSPFRADRVDLPAGVDTEAWAEWCKSRSSRRKPISEQAAKKQIGLLLQHPPAVQRQIIESSIANDYQGLFPPKGGGRPLAVVPTSRATSLAEDLNDTSWAR
tara:strand:+ start:21292 stop:22050 length:759 start_codon:yes stop_codon:yes gene_type:complete